MEREREQQLKDRKTNQVLEKKGGGPRVCPALIGRKLGQRWSLNSGRFIKRLTQMHDLKIDNE